MHWIADGFHELEKAIAAKEWEIATEIAKFIDQRGAWGAFAVDRLAEARDPRRRR